MRFLTFVFLITAAATASGFAGCAEGLKTSGTAPMAPSTLAADTTASPNSAPAADTGPASTPDAGDGLGNDVDGAAMADADAGPRAFELSIEAVDDGGVYPEEYSCNGDDVLPAMTWPVGPDGTLSYALLFTDLEADLNDGRFVHWALYDIPATTTELPRDIGGDANPPVPAGSTQVRGWSASCGAIGGSQFLGPCPSESHDYMFELYALSVEKLEGANCNQQPIEIAELIEGDASLVLARTTITSNYTPP